jgi:hypothetical protein
MQNQPGSELNGRWYLLVALAYLAGLLSLGVALWHNLGFPLDDSWIHQEIARNLVEHHTFGFNPGQTSSGSSSNLWTLILSVNYLLFPNWSPVIFPLVLNSILIVISGILLWKMSVRDGLPLSYSLAIAVLPAFTGNYIWLAFIGMEHVLFVTLSLAAILLWVRVPLVVPKSESGTECSTRGIFEGHAVAAGLALAALGMTRPEGLALSVLLFALYKWCGRIRAEVVWAATADAVFLLPSFLFNLKTSGSLLPLTLRGRRFLYLGTDKVHLGRSTVLSLTGETYSKVIQHNFFHSTSGWISVAVVLAAYGALVVLQRFPSRVSLLLLWAAMDYSAYCVTLPSTGHGGRYQPFVFILFPALLAIALMKLVSLFARMLKFRQKGLMVPAHAVILALVGCLTAATLPRWSKATRDSIYDIDHCHRQMAYWLDAHYPANTSIGVFDIGAIAYFSHMNVIDLGGLVDPKFFDYLVAGRVPDYLKEKGASLVVLPSDGKEAKFADRLNLANNPALRLDPIHSEGVDYDTWLDGNLYTQQAYRFETLYRIVSLNADGSSSYSPLR